MADVQLISMNLPNDEDTYYFTDKDAQDKIDALGTASTKNVPTSGDAGNNEVVLGNDTRLTDARPASDVSAWAKESTKPSYTKSEVGLDNVDNTSDSTKKTNFTGSIASGNTGFTTGGDVYTALGNKVDKVTGKQLSTEDYTTAEKTKLSGISTGANKTEASTTNGNIKIDSVETPVYRNYGNNAVLTTDKTPFLTRQTLNPTGFSGYVREKLVGASYAWNQLVQNGNFANTDGWNVNGSSTLSVSSNIATFTAAAQNNSMYQSNRSLIASHKYLATVQTKLTSATDKVALRLQGMNIAFTSANTSWQTVSAIYSCGTTENTVINVMDTRTSGWDAIQIKNFQLIDLTVAFGSTIADYLYNLSDNGGITKLRDMGFPIDKYTPYGYGLYSVKTSGKKIVGKNLIEDVELGAYGPSGTSTGDNTRIKSKNPCLLIGGQTYTLSATSYVSGKTVNVSLSTYSYSNGTYTRITDYGWLNSPYTFTAESGLYYGFTAKLSDSSVCDFKNLVIQLELGSRATAYEEPSITTYPLGNDELRGKFDLVNGEIVASGDVKESNGEITRNWKDLNLGDETWTRYSFSGTYAFYVTKSDMKSSNPKGTFAKYAISSSASVSSMEDKSVYLANQAIYIRDDSYTDATTFKTSLSGLHGTYELATPTTEQSTPFADPMSLVGATTEEYIDTRDIPCPVGAERQYMGQSEDVVEIPSSPQSDGKRVLFAQTSGNETQYYFDTPTLYYKEYVVQGDGGTKTYGDLLTELKPYYEVLSEDEKTYSKVIMRANATGNECLAFVGNYWYSRMGVNAIGLWIDQIDFQNIKYYRGTSGQAAEDLTNTSAGDYTIALRVLTYTREVIQ